jgi:hypothetical protein
MEEAMKAYNIVRFKVKPGEEAKFIAAHANFPKLPGMEEAALIDTGNRTFCVVAKWANFEAIVAARPQMIGVLDSLRGLLEDLGGGLGVTDPVSGSVVMEL